MQTNALCEEDVEKDLVCLAEVASPNGRAFRRLGDPIAIAGRTQTVRKSRRYPHDLRYQSTLKPPSDHDLNGRTNSYFVGIGPI
jgi:hypothetical protein